MEDSKADAVGGDLIVESLPADAEAARRGEFVAAGLSQDLDDLVSLHGRQQGQGGLSWSCARVRRKDGKIAYLNLLAVAHEHGALHFVLQLAHITGPVMFPKKVESRRAELEGDTVLLGGKALQERFGQGQDFLGPLAQRRYGTGDRKSVVSG